MSFAEITLSFTTSLHSYLRVVTATRSFSSYLDVQRRKEPLPLLPRCSVNTELQPFVSIQSYFSPSDVTLATVSNPSNRRHLRHHAARDIKKTAPDPGRQADLKRLLPAGRAARRRIASASELARVGEKSFFPLRRLFFSFSHETPPPPEANCSTSPLALTGPKPFISALLLFF